MLLVKGQTNIWAIIEDATDNPGNINGSTISSELSIEATIELFLNLFTKLLELDRLNESNSLGKLHQQIRLLMTGLPFERRLDHLVDVRQKSFIVIWISISILLNKWQTWKLPRSINHMEAASANFAIPPHLFHFQSSKNCTHLLMRMSLLNQVMTCILSRLDSVEVELDVQFLNGDYRKKFGRCF